MSVFFVPATKEVSDEVAEVARRNGCLPHWNESCGAWCCSCADGTHMADQQCSIINRASSTRKKTR